MTNATAPAQENSEYHIAQILIALPEGATPEQIEAGRQQAQEVLEQLRQGADFQRLAVTVSDGRQALEGGDLGWRTAEQLPTIFADVVPQLQPGQFSDSIRSPSGFHIVKLVDAKGAAQQNMTQTRTQTQTQTQTYVRHILINTNEVVSDEEARQRLLRLRERIQNGEDFAELARANSNDTVSAIKGGDLGWISSADLVPEFETQMNELSPGEVSEPFQTRFGWHLVQVLERRQQQGTDEARRAKVRELLFQRRVEEEWDLWLRRLRDEAYVEIRLPTVGAQETS
jgi:peptidyl-prolyl cis-trans isomerase SurA